MTLTLDISDDLKPEELGELVELARERAKPIGALILEAARALASQGRGSSRADIEGSPALAKAHA